MRLEQLGGKIWVFMHACLKMTADDPFFVRLLLLNLSSFYVIYSTGGMESWNLGYTCLTLGAFFTTNLLFAFCCIGLGRRGKLAVLAISAIFAMLDALAYLTLRQVFYLSYFGLIADTNMREAVEFINGNFAGGTAGWLVLAITVLTILPTFQQLAFKGWQLGLKRFPRALTAIALVLSMFYLGCVFIDSFNRFRPSANSIIRWGLQFADAPKWFAGSFKEVPEVQSYVEYPYVVVVLGESASRLHFSLYGYNLPTTPIAEKEAADGNLIPFTEAEAPEHFTRGAIPYILTTKTRSDGNAPWTAFPSIYDILSQTRYETFWISNQENCGILGTGELAFSKQNEHQMFTHYSSQNEYQTYYDERLLPLLDEAMQSHSLTRPQFYLLHLIGSHQQYDRRYPKDFTAFQAEDEQEPKSEQGRLLRAQYDTSICYTDTILQEIYDRFRDKEAIVIYLSDHGEDVYDFQKDYLARHTPEGSHEELMVPLTIWGSDAFIRNNPAMWQKLRDKRNEPFNTENLPELLWLILSLKLIE